MRLGLGMGMGLPRSASWTPARLAGLVAWYDEGALVDGSSWAGTRGYGPTLAQGTSSLRALDRGPVWEAGGRRGLWFDGVDDRLDAPSNAVFDCLHQASGSTLFVVATPYDFAGYGTILNSMTTTSTNGPGVWLAYNGPAETIEWTVARVGSSVGGRTAVSPLAQRFLVCCRMRPSNSTVSMRLNGGANSEAAWNTPSALGAPQPLRLGMTAGASPAYPFNGVSSAVLVFDRELSDAECAQVEAWLLARYAAPSLANDTAPLAPLLSGTRTVMYVGDSITSGANASGAVDGGFARVAYDLGAGRYDHVGPLGAARYSDDAHNGRSGWILRRGSPSPATDGHYPGGNANSIETVIGPGGSYHPEVIVLLLGTNNLAGTTAYITSRNHLEDWRDLVVQMAALEPSARFVLCSLLRRTGAGESARRIVGFNRGLANAIAELKGRGIKIIARDWYSALLDADMTSTGGDGLHPGNDGHTKLGTDAHTALRLALGEAV